MVKTILRELDTLGRFYVIIYKGNNFYDFMFPILLRRSVLKRVLSEWNEIAPLGANSFL